ncbi:MAG: hypothetical protein OHK0038_09770 [Flammeovirgaceae bacterium]
MFNNKIYTAMKKVLFAIALILVIFAQEKASANPVKDTDNTRVILTEEEMLIEAALEVELSVNEEEVIAELTASNQINEVLVYDMKGNLLHAQKSNIDLSKIPSNAVLAMTDGNTQYYIAQ